MHDCSTLFGGWAGTVGEWRGCGGVLAGIHWWWTRMPLWFGRVAAAACTPMIFAPLQPAHSPARAPTDPPTQARDHVHLYQHQHASPIFLADLTPPFNPHIHPPTHAPRHKTMITSINGGVLFLRPCPATERAMMNILNNTPKLRFSHGTAEQDFFAWWVGTVVCVCGWLGGDGGCGSRWRNVCLVVGLPAGQVTSRERAYGCTAASLLAAKSKQTGN